MLKVANSVINASQIKTPITFVGDVTLSTGNLVIGTSGKGIDFSITSHPAGMTSELLADYEEGTFTPAQGSGLTVVGAYSSVGRYTKIGRTVFVSGILIGATTIATTAGTQMFTGLPFTILENAATGTFSNSALNVIGGIGAFGTQAYSTTTVGPTGGLDFSFSYTV